MSLVVLLNSCNYGSTGNICIDIRETAKECAYEVFFCYPASRSNFAKKIEQSITLGNRFERNLHLRLAEWSGYQGGFSHFGTLSFLKKMDVIKPDTVHLHNLHNCYINLPMLFRWLKKRNMKVVWTLHDCWAFTGHCPHFDMIGCDKWKTGCHNCPQYKEYPSSKIDNAKLMYHLKKKWFTGVEDMTIVTPSKWLADLVKQSFLKEYPVKVIHNGIDLSVFQPTESGFRKKYHLEEKKILLGVASPWSERKGLDVFIELAKRLDERYQIVLVGLTNEQKESLPANMIGIERTANPKELAKLYTAADIFLNPTREDNFPTVNLEALACGTPVLTFQTGGSPESLDENCGIVVEKGDVDGMKEAIYRLTENPIDSNCCINRAKMFDKNEKFMDYINLYQQNLESGTEKSC
ncbi:glycosyltransferase [Acetivibrio sp. MSJd-27]|uniref:glycosyltransferase n=1 Tax=Acetivibrio sp. MSJd-27 TaxID=2841523 RepID=UPI001C1207A6|nr:glycosyltransferase [Acetivibrio sp. MSJd-27]MBU5450128.1 glycosyltransferase [Acetivibrio sp. MSJd-27]